MSAPNKALRTSLPALLALVISPFAGATEYFVSLSGKDTNPGTIDAPFRSIKQGLVALAKPGDILNLRHGVYVEKDGVQIRKKSGANGNPIVIQSYPGEHAYIDGSLDQFRKKNNADWERASIYDQDAHRDEFVSVATFIGSSPDRGAFLDRNPYTRLITYARLEDLRSDNHYFARITDPADTREGPLVYEPCKPTDPNPPCAWTDAKGDRYRVLDTPEMPRHRRPWVYMGPGIWFDDRPDSPTAGNTNPGGKLQFDTLNAKYYASPFFDHSKHRYPPGYEDRGFERDPLFLRIDPEGIPQPMDDLRLSDLSPAAGTGAALPDELAALVNLLDPPPGNGAPDIGAYPFGSAPLRVGVDGRKSFPSVGQ